MAKAQHIQVLSDHVANKIAAGEVVERPASILKELLENAIDAGATQIDVEIIAGGKKSIIVADNGSGMGRDDALLAIERYATSKIKDVDDIECVSTLGFRGEALAAICSVSRTTLATRLSDELEGTEVSVSGGKVREVKEVGCPVGTTLTVRNLFFNVPARRKFLRSEQTELSHLRQLFLTFALSHPDVGMRLVVDGKEAYKLPGGVTLVDRIRGLFDADLVRALRPIEYEADGVKVSGYAGAPHVSRGDRSGQYIFVNRRAVNAPLLAHAINEGYRTLVPARRYPVLFLFVDVDPTQVDVNVHPTKKEVRFRRPLEARDAVIEALRQALAEAPLDQAAAVPGAGSGPRTPSRGPALSIPDMPSARTFQYPRLPFAQDEAGPVVEKPAEPDASDEAVISGSPWSWCRVLGQVGGLYVVLETEDGLVLMDPHAAHERVLFERFMKEVITEKVKSQGLLAPESVDLTPQDALCVRKNLEALAAMGFGISEFGGDTFIVDALPTCLGDVSAVSVLTDVAQGLEQAGKRGGAEKAAEERIAQAACKAAVKARNKLTLSEIERLVVDLAEAEMPYTCPHGRPTLIFMGFTELDRKFGRV